MFWRIVSFPKCTHHVFLSHCAEDRQELVLPIYDSLSATGVLPWLDQEDYYYGRNSRAVLRDGILRSRHVIFFVTEAMLTTARGWCIFELAFTELLELNFQMVGGQLSNAFLPIFFVPQNDDRLPRSVWQATRDRSQFFRPGVDGDRTTWCVQIICDFLRREQTFTHEIAELLKYDPKLKKRLQETPGLFERVARIHPKRIDI